MTNFVKNVRKVVCIGRNYADHAKELGNKQPKQPFFFLKPPSAILEPNQGPILRPKGTNLHYELELGLVMGQKLRNLDISSFTKKQALNAISGYTLALDLTARNVQSDAKKNGLPWSIAKGFDTFLPLSDLIAKEKISDPDNAFLQLKINNEVRQSDPTSLMVFKIPQLLATISQVMTLEPGDIVLTGTPKGVGEIVPGDHLEGELRFQDNVVGTLSLGVEDKPGPYQYHQD